MIYFVTMVFPLWDPALDNVWNSGIWFSLQNAWQLRQERHLECLFRGTDSISCRFLLQNQWKLSFCQPRKRLIKPITGIKTNFRRGLLSFPAAVRFLQNLIFRGNGLSVGVKPDGILDYALLGLMMWTWKRIDHGYDRSIHSCWKNPVHILPSCYW